MIVFIIIYGKEKIHIAYCYELVGAHNTGTDIFNILKLLLGYILDSLTNYPSSTVIDVNSKN